MTDRWSLSFVERLRLRTLEDRARRIEQRERRRSRDGWVRIPENKVTPTLDEAFAALRSPCYEVFRDAEGINWMRKVL